MDMSTVGIVAKVLGGLAAPVVGYLERRGELKQARFEAQLKMEQALGDRQAQLIREGLAADANWEMEFARQAATSNKDEWILAIVSVPAILCFVKFGPVDGPAIVAAGMAALNATPWWFQAIMGSMFLHTIGVRWWRRRQYDTEDEVDGKSGG
jgi:hypothetical protein